MTEDCAICPNLIWFWGFWKRDYKNRPSRLLLVSTHHKPKSRLLPSHCILQIWFSDGFSFCGTSVLTMKGWTNTYATLKTCKSPPTSGLLILVCPLQAKIRMPRNSGSDDTVGLLQLTSNQWTWVVVFCNRGLIIFSHFIWHWFNIFVFMTTLRKMQQ